MLPGFNLTLGYTLLYLSLIAWVLVRYPFPGKKVLDALVDLPFALPTAVAGISPCWASRAAERPPSCASSPGWKPLIAAASCSAGKIPLKNSGNIEQIGSPQEVWDHPASAFVYGFLGDVNLFRGRAPEGEMLIGEDHHGARLATPEHSGAQDAKAFAALALTEGETLLLTPRKARVFVS